MRTYVYIDTYLNTNARTLVHTCARKRICTLHSDVYNIISVGSHAGQ